ncbi:MAG: 16S rRNA (cytosine(1402)-N(4))-methyltransferase RsmH [Nocardioidaceae bacterium]|nr:16S rRNA (cytosine(1402)-N(4))-methyltransferase RsmH [Nocardioidaceae bacterium]
MAASHVPVMLDRVLDLLAPALTSEGAVLVDATVGLGGHSHAVLDRFTGVHVIGIDRDAAALGLARERLGEFAGRVTFVETVYDRIAEVVQEQGHTRVSAVLFDLGVSSMQLDQIARGFSYAHDAPLDMRMGTGDSLTAAEVLNTYSVDDLARVLRVYGEERFARRIAAAVVAERLVQPLETSARLVEIIGRSIPAAARRTGGNPAKRTFQALRIEVNDELNALRGAVPAACASVCLGGRVVTMAYHSLEDRIVKRVFAGLTSTDVPPDLPVVPPELRPTFTLVTRGAEKASVTEATDNRRSRSVRVRAVQRVRDAA